MGPEQMSEDDKEAKIAELEGEPSTVASVGPSPVTGEQVQPGPAAPSQLNATGAPVAPKSRFRLSKKLVIIIAGVILLLSGGSAWAYVALVYQNPTSVVFDAVSNYLKASNVSTKTIIKTSSPIDVGEYKASVKLEFDSAETNAPSFEGKAKLTLTVDDKNVELKSEVRFVESGALYFRIDDLDKAIEDAATATGGSMSMLPEGYMEIIKKMQNKWVEISADNLKKISVETSKSYQCVVDVMKKYKDDQSMLDIYKQHPFLNVKDNLGVKDGNQGYKVELNKDKFKEFSKATDDTQFNKDLNACYSKGTSSETPADALADTLPDNIDVSVSLWVSQWSHQLNKAEMVVKINGGDSGVDYAIDGNTDFTYGTSVQPATVPAGAVSVYDWIMDVAGPLYADIQERAEATSLSSSANMVQKKAEAYYAITAKYPANVAAFAEHPETKLTETVTVIGNLAKTSDTITYIRCSVGAQVAYYDSSTDSYKITNIGNAMYTSQTALCK